MVTRFPQRMRPSIVGEHCHPDVRRITVDPARPRGGLSYETLLATVEQRLAQVPRYRQKVREVWIGAARPVWIDDSDFDITYHVRRWRCHRQAVTSSCTSWSRDCRTAAGQVRPLWEMSLVEGLSKNRVASTQVAPGADQRYDRAGDRHVIADRTRNPPPFPKTSDTGRRTWIHRLLLGALGDWALGQARSCRPSVPPWRVGNQLRRTAGRRSPRRRCRTHIARGTRPAAR